MRAVVCRVHSASVRVDGQTVGSIERGLLVFVGFLDGDDPAQIPRLAERLAQLRLFKDDDGKLNLSVEQEGGSILLIPNFTLAGRTRKGTRPSFSDAADPAVATEWFDRLKVACAEHVPVAAGVFRAHMDIDASFNGPVTVIVEL